MFAILWEFPLFLLSCVSSKTLLLPHRSVWILNPRPPDCWLLKSTFTGSFPDAWAPTFASLDHHFFFFRKCGTILFILKSAVTWGWQGTFHCHLETSWNSSPVYLLKEKPAKPEWNPSARIPPASLSTWALSDNRWPLGEVDTKQWETGFPVGWHF